MFWILNKKNDAPSICGSIIAVSKETQIKKERLYETFSRKKEMDYKTEKYRIHKVEVVKSKRK